MCSAAHVGAIFEEKSKEMVLAILLQCDITLQQSWRLYWKMKMFNYRYLIFCQVKFSAWRKVSVSNIDIPRRKVWSKLDSSNIKQEWR